MKRALIKSLWITTLFYIVSNAIVLYNEYRFEKELKSFDLNNNGTFETNERIKEQQKAMERVTNDTARIFAPYTLVAVSIVIGLFPFFIMLLIKKQ